MKSVKKFLKDDAGATAIEYGLIVGLIAVAIVAVVATLGDTIASKFQEISDKLSPAATN